METLGYNAFLARYLYCDIEKTVEKGNLLLPCAFVR